MIGTAHAQAFGGPAGTGSMPWEFVLPALHWFIIIGFVIWAVWLMMRGHYWPAAIVALIAFVKVLP